MMIQVPIALKILIYNGFVRLQAHQMDHCSTKILINGLIYHTTYTGWSFCVSFFGNKWSNQRLASDRRRVRQMVQLFIRASTLLVSDWRVPTNERGELFRSLYLVKRANYETFNWEKHFTFDTVPNVNIAMLYITIGYQCSL